MSPQDETQFRSKFLNRTLPFLTENGAETLKYKTVGVAGCGGVGGATAVTLARMGVGHFHLADPGVFDTPDINRQWGASTKTLGKKKIDIYREWIQDINPFATVEVWQEGIQEGTLETFLKDCDLLIDCLDLSVPPKTRGEMFERARRQGVFAISAPIFGFGTIVVGADPKGMPISPLVKLLESSQAAASFPKILYRFFMPEHLDLIAHWLDEKKTKVPSTAIAPLVAASVVATESLAALIGDKIPGGRRPVSLPQIFLLDLFRMSYAVVNAEMLLKKEGNGKHEA